MSKLRPCRDKHDDKVDCQGWPDVPHRLYVNHVSQACLDLICFETADCVIEWMQKKLRLPWVRSVGAIYGTGKSHICIKSARQDGICWQDYRK